MDYETETLWHEINDMPGEIFDIPEMQDVVLDSEKESNSDEEDDSWYTDPNSKASYHHYW